MASDQRPGPNLLEREIASAIAIEGPMSLARYMELCLAHPVHGFYMSGEPFGAHGHFTTAPEISQMFGELIGLWCGAVWASMGAPDPVHLVELGPGRGTLMDDLLRAAAKVPGFPDAARLHLIEISPALRAAQHSALAAHADRIRWHDSSATIPAGPLIVIGNEFLDALPVRQFQKTGRGWCERVVGLDVDGRLCLGLSADPVPSSLVPVGLRDGPAGVIAETSAAVRNVVFDLACRLVAGNGAALFIDYGYAVPAHGDSLQAVHRHRFAPILEAPGECDLTAHVSFSAVADAARAAGATAYGPITQAAFLGGLGLSLRADALRAAAPGNAAAVDAAVRRLTDRAEMGELFKAIAIASPTVPAPPPFDALGTTE